MQEGAEHSHSSDVTSVGIDADGNLSFAKAQRWLSKLLQVGRHAPRCMPPPGCIVYPLS